MSLLCAAPAHAAGEAPGAPGAVANWTRGDKDGFGTARPLGSRVWFTLQGGELTEVYAPDLGTPSFRDLQFVVSDGRTFSERETDVAKHVTRLSDARSLTYRQVSSTRRWRLTKTYVADPQRAAVLVDVRFQSLTDRPYRLYVLADPALSNTGDDDTAARATAADATNASALATAPALTKTSVGYMGASDGWTDLRDDHRMDWAYDAASTPGNVVQTGATPLTGLRGHRHLTLALGFAAKPEAAASVADAALRRGFRDAARAYAAGWHRYLGRLDRPRSAAGIKRLYDASLMVMAATEDKTFRGALIAAPSMPWVWGNIAGYSGPYHLVWSRDAYQVATAMLAAGDRAAADRAVSYLFARQQQADGCFPQNSNVDGSPHWPNLQLDEVADPIILSWQLRRFDAGTWAHVKRAADCIVANGPATQERWENMTGYSPASIAAEVAGLVCAAAIAERNGADAAAADYLAVADERRRRVDEWTLTTNGPLSRNPYYVRVTVDGKPNAGTRYETPDHGPVVDQRQVVDPSFLELARLGVKPPRADGIVKTLPVVDRELGVDTRNGRFWHRFNFDGYGELPDGGPFGTAGNRGRLWPIFAGERGEYELLTGDAGAARGRLRSIAATANDGRLLPEQVWDDRPPPGYTPGEPTFSATPLGWTHAQLVRLAWSLDAGRPVEQPAVVARRYAR
ncbi:MAG TPA: glycoside hydrolase family 15 protein [Solirubrobacteraceae bacterium]|nr:glycoside hydrolase family 15 protein [Solirubrobacteraceae bacterium]